MTIRPRITSTLLAVTLALTGCGSGRAPTGRRARIEIGNYAFRPQLLTVPAGTAITFTNRDATAHTATATNRRFDSGTVSPGASRTIVLHASGTYTYYCEFHPFMRATIRVTSAST